MEMNKYQEAITYFQNGRFYPITIPKVMEE